MADGRIRQCMSFNNDVDLVADSFSDCLESFVADQQIAAAKQPYKLRFLHGLKVNFVDVNFDSVIAVGQCLFSRFRILFGRRKNFLFFSALPQPNCSWLAYVRSSSRHFPPKSW